MKTALFETHVKLQARMIPFAGWEMPIQYKGILAESSDVRNCGGIFDVSHMGRIHISGDQSTNLLDWIETGNIETLRQGRARYSLICNEAGGILDDTVTYRLDDNKYLLICNASNRDTILDWINLWRKEKYPDTHIDDITPDTVMIAVQGPSVATLMDQISPQQPSSLRFFGCMEISVSGIKALIGRTGYTGEDGFELVINTKDGAKIWNILMNHGMSPCGLGARDVLRLEAGLALHGSDIDPSVSPLEAGLGRFVKLKKDFIGAPVLRLQQQSGLKKQLVGLYVEGRNIPRHGYPICLQEDVVGKISSGGYSPALDRNIAMGYVPPQWSSLGQNLKVDIRGKLAEATVTALPFYTRK